MEKSKRRSLPVLMGGGILLGVVALPLLKGMMFPPGKDTIPWRTDFDAALAEAGASGKLVLLDFTASWCPPCQVMKRQTFPSEKVKAAVLAHFIPVQLDIDLPENQHPVERYGISSIPTLVITDAQGMVVDADGFMTESRMLSFLDRNSSR